MATLTVEDLYVFDELENLLPPASKDEMARLKDSVLNGDGFRDPIIYWANPPDNKPCIVDGHRRYRLYMGDPDVGDIAPSTKGMRFKDLDAVKQWMLKTQLERRNLTIEGRDAALARLLELEKEKSRPAHRPAENPDKTSANNERHSDASYSDGKAAERVAEQTGVSTRTVERAEKRDAERAEALRNIKVADADFAAEIEAGQHDDFLSDADKRKLGKMPRAEIRAAAKLIRLEDKRWKGEKPTKPAAKTSKPEAASIIKDALDRDVPDALREKHAVGVEIVALSREFDRLKKRLREIFEKPGGEFLTMSSIESKLSEIKKQIADARYYTECPSCAGEKPSKQCHRCKGAGFVPRSMKGVLSEAEKGWLGV